MLGFLIVCFVTIQGGGDRALTVPAFKSLLDKNWLKTADQIVLHSAGADFAPLIQMAVKEKQTVCFVGDHECPMMIESASVSCV